MVDLCLLVLGQQREQVADSLARIAFLVLELAEILVEQLRVLPADEDVLPLLNLFLEVDLSGEGGGDDL